MGFRGVEDKKRVDVSGDTLDELGLLRPGK